MKMKWYHWLGAVLLLLLVVRMILPQVGLYAINWTLKNKLENFTGHLEDFDLSLYRGAYQLEGLSISEKGTKQKPLLQIARVDLQIAWQPLLRQKEISGNIRASDGLIQLFDSKDKKKKQVGDSVSWQKTLALLIPMRVNSLVLRNWSLYFTNNDLREPLPVKAEEINLTAENLRNRPKDQQEALVPISGSALLQRHARLKLDGKIDGLAAKPRVDIDVQLTGFQMKTLNKLLLAYIPLDITQGELGLYAEMATSQGNTKGYANLFLKDGDIIAPKQDFSSLKHFGYELVGAVANWFLQDNKQELASHIPFSGKGAEFEIDAKEAFWSAVNHEDENRLKPGLENSIDLGDVEPQKNINSASR